MAVTKRTRQTFVDKVMVHIWKDHDGSWMNAVTIDDGESVTVQSGIPVQYFKCDAFVCRLVEAMGI